MALTARPVNEEFGIRVDSRDVGMCFANPNEAERAAATLIAHGYQRIEIFDRRTRRVVKHVSPSPTAA